MDGLSQLVVAAVHSISKHRTAPQLDSDTGADQATAAAAETQSALAAGADSALNTSVDSTEAPDSARRRNRSRRSSISEFAAAAAAAAGYRSTATLTPAGMYFLIAVFI